MGSWPAPFPFGPDAAAAALRAAKWPLTSLAATGKSSSPSTTSPSISTADVPTTTVKLLVDGVAATGLEMAAAEGVATGTATL
jgi:hypothetical protein